MSLKCLQGILFPKSSNKTFQTLEDAAKEVQTHLISKCLLKKFIKDVKAKDPTMFTTEPIYSDILILEESKSIIYFY